MLNNTEITTSNMPEDLGFGCLGNGTTVWDRKRTQNNDYLKVAHIAADGSHISYYEPLSNEAKKRVEKDALSTYKLCSKKLDHSFPDRFAVIVKTEYSPGKINLGVQYWTPEMIDTGELENSDHTISYYLGLRSQIKKGQGEAEVKLSDCENAFGDRFCVNTECQPDYFKTFTSALKHFNNL